MEGKVRFSLDLERIIKEETGIIVEYSNRLFCIQV